MSAENNLIPPELSKDLLLQYKYLETIRKISRGITHDYNNIFTGLGGQISMLIQEAERLVVPVKRQELINDLIERGVERTDLLFAFIRESQPGKVLRKNSVAALSARAADLLNCISRFHRVEVICRGGLPPLVCSGRDIILMLVYLGENAIEAAPNGTIITIEVLCQQGKERAGADLRFRCINSGGCFPEKFIGQLFEPFRIVGDGEKHTGLGLYAANVLASRYGGSIRIETDTGDQTVVSASFRIDDAYISSDSAGSKSKVGGSNQDSADQKHCILVVEDDEAMRVLLLQKLQKKGHMVFCVSSCAEAIEEYSQLSDLITVVLMDVGLGDGSGYDCCREISGKGTNAHVILMSGEPADNNELSEAGCRAFLKKPFKIKELERIFRDIPS